MIVIITEAPIVGANGKRLDKKMKKKAFNPKPIERPKRLAECLEKYRQETLRNYSGRSGKEAVSGERARKKGGLSMAGARIVPVAAGAM